MKASKKIARQFVFPMIMNLGIEKLVRNSSNNSILNIMYHGVVPQNATFFSSRNLTIEQFEKQLKYFIKEFEILSLREAFDCYRNHQKTKRKAITISFDDGYKNNLKHVLPLLEKYNIKATFFVSGACTQEMDVRAFWYDLIACLNYYHSNEIIEIEGYRFINFYESNKKLNIYDFIKSLPPKILENTIARIEKKYALNDKLKQISPDIWELMNQEDVQELSKSKNVDIGSHGNVHYDLGLIGIDDAAIELKKSKELLEATIDMDVDTIAYPFGSYTNIVKNLAETIGYNKQIAVSYQCSDDKTDLRILSRHGISSTTTFESNMFFLSKAFISSGYN